MTALESDGDASVPSPASTTMSAVEPGNVVVIDAHAPRPRGAAPTAFRVAIACAAAALLIAVGAVVVWRDDSSVGTPPPSRPAPTTTVVFAGGTVSASHSFESDEAQSGDAPKRITLAADGLWVALGRTGLAELLDRETLTVIRTVDTGLTSVNEIVDAGGFVWFAGDGGVVTLANGADATSARPTLRSDGEWTVATGGGLLWAAQVGGSTLHRVDLASGAESAFATPEPISLLAAGSTRVWTFAEPTDTTPARMFGYDGSTGAVATTSDVTLGIGVAVGSLLATDDGVWLAGGGLGAFVREIANDGTAGLELPIAGDYADGMAIDGDGIWIAVRFGNAAYRVSMVKGTIEDQVTVPDRTADVAVDGGALFVASYRERTVQRIIPSL